MELDNKRKKRVARAQLEADQGERERERSKKPKGEEEVAGGSGSGSGSGEPAAVPTEEEVEEFFAILRRMKVAVKYFDEKGRVGGKEWREALEQAEVTVEDGENLEDDDGDHHREGAAFGEAKKINKEREVIINEGLDLNAVAPEAAEGGGA